MSLFLAEDGRPSIGLFRRIDPSWPEDVKEELSGPRVQLVGAVEVRVLTKEPEPVSATLVLRVQGRPPLELSGERLASLPSAPAPEAPRGSGLGRLTKLPAWHLADVVSLQAEPDTVAWVRLVGASGAELLIEPELLRSREDPRPLLHEGQGTWKLVVWTVPRWRGSSTTWSGSRSRPAEGAS